MEVEIRPTEKIEKLRENLEQRFGKAEEKGEIIKVETDEPSKISKIPGVDNYSLNGEKHEGLKGSPVDVQAYARLENRKDAAKAFLATVMGYDLRILDTDREWDYRNLKRYNPRIKHLKFEEPRDFLGIEKSLFRSEKTSKIKLDLDDEDVTQVYRRLCD